MNAEPRYQRRADLTRRQRVHHLFEFGHEHAGAGPAQVAALRSAAIFRVFTRQRRKIGLPGQNSLSEIIEPVTGRGFTELRCDPQQNMAHPALRHRHLRHAGAFLVQHLEDVKTGARTHQRRNIAHAQLPGRLQEDRRVATGSAQAQLPTAGALCGIRKFLGQSGKIVSGPRPLQRALCLGLQGRQLRGAGLIRHRHENLGQVDFLGRWIAAVLLLLQVLVDFRVGYAHPGFDIAFTHTGHQDLVAQPGAE